MTAPSPEVPRRGAPARTTGATQRTSSFSVTAPRTSLTVDAERRGSFGVDVKNETAQDERVVVTIHPESGAATGSAAADGAWFGADQQLPLRGGVSEHLTVDVTVPPAVPPGSYAFTPVAYSADGDPAETEARGPRMTLAVPALPMPPVPWWRRWWWLLALGVVLVLAVGAVLFFLLRPPGTATVPDVAGRPAAEATTLLGEAGLDVSRADEATGSAAPETALRTDPPAGAEVEQGATVSLVVAVAPPSVSIPGDLVGLPLAEARSLVEAAGLTVSEVVQQPSSVPPGVVIGSEPPAGQAVEPLSGVRLVVSSGMGTVTVPPVVGLSVTVATSRLGEAGLQVQAQIPALCRLTPCRVQSQDPGAGIVVPGGTVVRLTASALLSTPEVTLLPRPTRTLLEPLPDVVGPPGPQPGPLVQPGG